MSFQYFQREAFAHRRGVLARVVVCLLASCAGLTTIACNQSSAVEWQTQQNHPTAFGAIHPNTVLHHPNVRNDVATTTGTLSTDTSSVTFFSAPIGFVPPNTSAIIVNAAGSITTPTIPGTFNISTTSGTGTVNITGASGIGSLNSSNLSGFSASSFGGATINISASATVFGASDINLPPGGNITSVSTGSTASSALTGTTITVLPNSGNIAHQAVAPPTALVPPPVATPAAPPASTTTAAVTPVGNVIDTSALNDSAMIGLLNSTNLTLAATGALNRASFAPWKKGSVDQIVSLPAPDSSQPDPGHSSQHEDDDVIIDTDND